jgi:hypothetical protein
MVSGTGELINFFALHYVVGELMVHAIADKFFELKDSVPGYIGADEILRAFLKKSKGGMTAIDLHFLVFFSLYHEKAFNTPAS